MTHQKWKQVLEPKVDGAWNLHNEFRTQELDFFVLASSLNTMMALPGGANYCSANTFLEAFCQYRHGLGLPASVLSICPIEDIGYVAGNPGTQKGLRSQGVRFLSQKELLDFFELAILSSNPILSAPDKKNGESTWSNASHIMVGLAPDKPLNDPDNQTSWRRDRRMGFYHNIYLQTDSINGTVSANRLNSLLDGAHTEPATLESPSNIDIIATEIGRKIFTFMLKSEEDVDPALSLSEIGMDSLMSIELQRWWKQAFGFETSVIELVGSGSLRGLAHLAVNGLKEKLNNKVGKTVNGTA
jgi:acyl carrier protein